MKNGKSKKDDKIYRDASLQKRKRNMREEEQRCKRCEREKEFWSLGQCISISKLSSVVMDEKREIRGSEL